MTPEEIIAGLMAIIRNLDVVMSQMRDEFGDRWLEMHNYDGTLAAVPALTAQAQAYAALVAIMATEGR